MQKVDLTKVLELVINEEQETASTLLHQWFVEKSKSIHESLMQEEDEVLENSDLENDQDEIEKEEHFGEGDLSEGDADGGEDENGDKAGAEAAADDLEGTLGAEGGEQAPEELPVEDRVEDLEAQLASLKAEFEKVMGLEEPEHGQDINGDGEIADAAPVEVGAIEGEPEVEESVFEDDAFVDLDESFQLEPVKDPGLNGGKEIGDDGAKVSLNDKSPIPQKKGPDRVGGKPVEIKAEEHKGYARETAPEVKSKPLLKNQVKNAKSDLTSVSKEGDKSAMLNKKDGFGSDSPKSPIGAGATDLRGNDMKRK